MVPSMEAVGTIEASPMNVRKNKTIRSRKARRRVDFLRSVGRNHDRRPVRTVGFSSAKREGLAMISSAAATPGGRSYNSRDGISGAVRIKALLFAQGATAIR